MYVAGTMLPFQILLLPVFILTNKLGLYNTYGSVILIHTAFQLGFCTFVLRNFMRTLPGEIMDAARMDGGQRVLDILAYRLAVELARHRRSRHPGVYLDLQRLYLGLDLDPR